MSEPIVITGFGCVTACGPTAAGTWESVLSGASGIAPVEDWDVSEWTYPLAGMVKDYNPRELVADRKLLKVIGRQDVLGLNAAGQALGHSGLLTHRETLDDATRFNDRTGVFAGSPASKYRQQYDYLPPLADGGDTASFSASAMEQVHPMWLLRSLPNNVLAYVGIQWGFKGPNHNFTDHGVSGTQAIAEACRYMQDGEIDRAVVVGYDCACEAEAVVYYASLGLLSPTGVRSFDASRDGTVLAEGAGAMVLETASAARARGARILGRVLGSSIVSEGLGVMPIDADGEGVSRAIRLALEQSGCAADEIGLITAHGNGSRTSDESEAIAIAGIFGERTVPVTAFKWCLGHTIAASGVIESILTLLCLRERRVPGIPALTRPASECAGLLVSAEETEPRSGTGLVITRAFAGLNSCIVLSREDL